MLSQTDKIAEIRGRWEDAGGGMLTNVEIESTAIKYVLRLESRAGRKPQDVRHSGMPYDIFSPPRKIEVKAFGSSARGATLPLEDSQVQEAKQDPENFYVYVVDNIASGDQTKIAIRMLHGAILSKMIDRATPHITYWPTLRATEYDQIADGVY